MLHFNTTGPRWPIETHTSTQIYIQTYLYILATLALRETNMPSLRTRASMTSLVLSVNQMCIVESLITHITWPNKIERASMTLTFKARVYQRRETSCSNLRLR